MLSIFKGCQYREHTIQIFNDRDRAILKLAQVAAEGSCLYETPPSKLLKTNNLNETWWSGVILTPTKERPGLLPQIILDGESSEIIIFFLYFFLLLNACKSFF